MQTPTTSTQTRQALEAFNERAMGQRIASVARELQAETKDAADEMDGTVADGLAVPFAALGWIR